MSNKNIVLVGNPNTGKTSFYNTLTRSFEHIGNWHGVTVDKKEKDVKIGKDDFRVIDLPGVYSLTAFSFEEKVTIEHLYKNQDTHIFNISDSNNIARNLYLTLQLLEAGKKPTLFLNFFDEAKKKGLEIDTQKLSDTLGVKVYSINANNKKIVKTKVEKALLDNCKQSVVVPYLKKLPLENVQNILQDKLSQIQLPWQFTCLKVLEQDETILEMLNLSENQQKQIENIVCNNDYISQISNLRYAYIEQVLFACVKTKTAFVYGKYKIDKLLLNKFFAIPFFICILTLVFYVTFSSVGSFLSEVLKVLIDECVGKPINALLVRNNAPIWVINLVSNGIISGVGGLLSFIPQIVLLFFFLSVLEDSGYLSRLAFLIEDIFNKVGLSGKSVFTLLMGFGCSTTAVMTARNVEDKNVRIKTAIITPYMSCSAKLPVYAVLGGVFFGAKNIFLIVGIYLLGVVVALVLSKILDKTYLKTSTKSFILEFAPYRFPSAKRVCYIIYHNCKLFLIKVGSVLLSLSVIVWILQNFSFKFEYVPNTINSVSMLQTIGQIFAPIFNPIGLGNWGVVSSLLIGVFAKEMIVSSFAIINNIPNCQDFDVQLGASLVATSSIINFTPLTSVVCMIFCLLYCPCLSTISVMKKEIGFKHTLIAVVLQFIIAYVICFVVYNIGKVANGMGVWYIVGILIVFLSIVSFIKTVRKNKLCLECRNCAKNCHKINF